jgi:hypothetical protein
MQKMLSTARERSWALDTKKKHAGISYIFVLVSYHPGYGPMPLDLPEVSFRSCLAQRNKCVSIRGYWTIYD